MKNNKTILFSAILIALIAVVGISGCKKDDTTNPTGTPKIKTFSYTQSNPNGTNIVTNTHFYDSEGRITSIIYSDLLGLADTAKYTYSTNKVVETGSSNIFTYTLNSAGLVTLLVDSIFGVPTTNSLTFTYDVNGHVTSKIHNGGVYTLYYGWEGDNMTTSNEQGGYTYTYLTDKANTVGNANKGMSFLGKDSKNLINTSVNSGTTKTYFYEFDSQNRATKINGSDSYTYY